MKKSYKNQIVIYVIAFMLVTAGYLSYTEKNIIEVSTKNENRTDENIGDATLVSSLNTSNENDEAILEKQEDEKSKSEKENDEEEKHTQNQEQSEEKNIKEETTIQEANTQLTEDDYFSYSKLEREKMYSQMLETYQKMLDNVNVSEEQKSIATQEIQKINDTKNATMICENLITTKGLKNVVIFVNKDSINIVVGEDQLTSEQTAQIQNIINREMRTEIENIHIMTH